MEAGPAAQTTWCSPHPDLSILSEELPSQAQPCLQGKRRNNINTEQQAEKQEAAQKKNKKNQPKTGFFPPFCLKRQPDVLANLSFAGADSLLSNIRLRPETAAPRARLFPTGRKITALRKRQKANVLFSVKKKKSVGVNQEKKKRRRRRRRKKEEEKEKGWGCFYFRKFTCAQYCRLTRTDADTAGLHFPSPQCWARRR